MSLSQKILLQPQKIPLLYYLSQWFTLSSWPFSNCVGMYLYTSLFNVCLFHESGVQINLVLHLITIISHRT